MATKIEITEKLVSLLPTTSTLTVKQAMSTWYCNLRSSGGLRLTEAGYQAFQLLEIENWKVSYDESGYIDKPTLLKLDKKIQFPYYIDSKKKQLVMFSSREAMLATLYGDLQKFLENYS